MSAISCHSGWGSPLAAGLLCLCFSCAHVVTADPRTLAGQWKTHTDARDYERALDVYASALLRYPDDRELQRHFVRSAEVLNELGDKEYGKEEFGQAERIYGALLASYRSLEGLAIRPSFTRAELQEKRTLAGIRGTEASAKQHFSRGDYRKVLDIYKNALPNFRGETRFLKSYAGAVEEVKQGADRAFALEDFGQTGQICRMLVANFPSFAPFVKTLSFSRQSLLTRISECSSGLTGKGLELYRQGKISEAIAVWEEILVFDDNPTTRKTIGTASEQLKKLRR